MKKERIGNGFGFRIAQFVIYLLSALALAGVCIGVHASVPKTFTDYLRGMYDGSSVGLSGEFAGGVIVFDGENIALRINGAGGPVEEYAFLSADDGAAVFTFDDGNGGEITVSYDNVSYGSFDTHKSNLEFDRTFLIVFVTLACIMGVISVLQLLTAYFGKKSILANNLCIALNAIFAGGGGLYGLFGLIGGVKGRMYTQYRSLGYESAPQTNCDENREGMSVGAGEPAEAMETAKAPAEAAAPPVAPHMSLKSRRGIMISVCVSYALLLLAGILFAAVPQIAQAIGDDLETRANIMSIGLMWIMLVPSLGLYFATVAPLGLSRKKKIVIFTLSAVLLAATTAAFFLIINFAQLEGNPINAYYEGEDVWFIPMCMVSGTVGLLACYGLAALKINPDKATRFKGIIKVKEKYPDAFAAAVTAILTWLVAFVAFIIAIICIAIFVLIVILYFVGVLSLASPYKSSYISADEVVVREKVYTYTDSHGYTQTAVSSDKKDFYDEGGSHVATSADGGKTAVFDDGKSKKIDEN